MIQGTALIVVAASFWFPDIVSAYALSVSAILIVFLGIPHGATDHIIFQHLNQSFLGSRRLVYFYMNYLLLGACFALIWWLLPVLALVVFLVISMYHFGQSNWNYVAFQNKYEAIGMYMLWGSLVTLAPIFYHFPTVSPIVESIIHQPLPMMDLNMLRSIVWTLLVLNILSLIYYWRMEKLSFTLLGNEFLNIGILMLLFVFAPTLLSFTIYFVCWHSFSSMLDQVAFLRQKWVGYRFSHYLKHLLPISLLVVGSILVAWWYLPVLEAQLDMGWLFMFISVVTLPHIILIDMLYEEKMLKI